MKQTNYTAHLRPMIFFLACLWFIPGQAAADLYVTEVPVSGEAVADRNQAIAAAFAQVLIQVTGYSDVASRPALQDLLAASTSYVQQYRYRLEAVDDDKEEAAPQRFIWVRFDNIAVNRALRERGMQPWTGTRPRLLLWLALEQNGQRRLFDPEVSPDTQRFIRARAQARGLPLQLPLMDIEDRTNMNAADLWAGYSQQITTASQRYPHDAVLSGKVRHLGQGLWRAEWLLLTDAGTNSQRFSSTDGYLNTVLGDGIDQAMGLLAQRYAPVIAGDSVDGITVQVNNVQTLRDYADVLQLFSRQDAVTSVTVRQAEADQLLLNVMLRGDQDTLARSLSLGGRLIQEYPAAVDSAQPSSDALPDLSYRLQQGN